MLFRLLVFCGFVLLVLLYAGLIIWFATWFMFWGLRGNLLVWAFLMTTGSSCWCLLFGLNVMLLCFDVFMFDFAGLCVVFAVPRCSLVVGVVGCTA